MVSTLAASIRHAAWGYYLGLRNLFTKGEFNTNLQDRANSLGTSLGRKAGREYGHDIHSFVNDFCKKGENK